MKLIVIVNGKKMEMVYPDSDIRIEIQTTEPTHVLDRLGKKLEKNIKRKGRKGGKYRP